MGRLGLDVLFDLDGTLVDSRPGIRRALLEAVEAVFPGRDLGGIEFAIGPPVREILQRSLEETSPEELDRLEVAFRASYDGGAWRESNAYSGVHETLAELRRRGFHCHIVTYKPASPTMQILGELDLRRYVDEVVCADSREPRFRSKAEMIRYLMEKLGIPQGKALYVGDSADDWSAAEECGLAFIGEEYGYGTFLQTEAAPRSIRSLRDLILII